MDIKIIKKIIFKMQRIYFCIVSDYLDDKFCIKPEFIFSIFYHLFIKNIKKVKNLVT
jgi:hypothetical protein